MFPKLKDRSKNKKTFKDKNISDWDSNDVTEWLTSINMGEYNSILINNDITGASLKTITDGELLSLGITKLGHRKKILSLINPSAINIDGSDSVEKTTFSGSFDNASVINVKVSHRDLTKKIKLSLGSKLSDLKDEIRDKFELKGAKFSVYYKDEDGDKIIISNEAEWEDCISENKNNIKISISTSSSYSSKQSQSVSPIMAFSVFDSLLQATIVIDEKAIMQYINPAAEKLTGFSKSESVGKNVNILMPEEFAREHNSYLANYIKTGKANVIGKGRNVTVMTKDGYYLPSYLQVTENMTTGKRMFVGTLSEAKEERKPQTVLQMAREVLDTLTNPAIAITDKGIIQVFNKPAQKLWGYNLSEVVGQNIKMLMPAEFADHHDKYINNYLTTGKAKIIGSGRNVTALLKDGTIKNVHLAISERKDGTQRIFTGVITVLN